MGKHHYIKMFAALLDASNNEQPETNHSPQQMEEVARALNLLGNAKEQALLREKDADVVSSAPVIGMGKQMLLDRLATIIGHAKHV